MVIFRLPAIRIWLVLSGATIVTTWVLSKDHLAASIATVATMLVAAWKVRLVLLHFMEVKDAARPWRIFFEAWVVVATAVVLVLYEVTAAAT
jgi:heme/copper-type cytochrome/quinol oxidase subunit 4